MHILWAGRHVPRLDKVRKRERMTFIAAKVTVNSKCGLHNYKIFR